MGIADRFARARVAALLEITMVGGCSSPDAPATGDAGALDAAPAFCLVGCLDASFDASLAVKVGGILGACAGDDCHNHGKGNLWISGAGDYGSLINVPSWEVPSLYRVKPGDPAQSYMYLKMDCDGGIDGACMPFGRPDPALARVVHDWIEAGAPTQ
jgi:hypothetical protein